MSNLRNARTALKMSQTELARALGVSQPTVSRLEKSEGEPPQLVRMALERLLIRRKVKVPE